MIKWIGTIASIIGSFAVASKFAAFGYILFLIGSFAWLIVGFNQKDKALITLNFVFFAANILGVYNYVL